MTEKRTKHRNEATAPAHQAPRGRDEPLLATCWTSAGDAASDRADLRSPVPLRERIEAASAAGFTGFGLLSADLPAAERDYGLSGIRSMLVDNGIVDLELEDIPYWWDDGPRRAESDRIRHLLLTAAEVLGARHIKVTPDGDNAPWDRDHWAAKFAELAGQAAGVGARLGIEFFGWSNIATLHDGLQLVEDCGHDAAGVVIDVWHIERAGTPVADLVSVPLDRIIGVELNDADPHVVGSLFEDTVHRRRYCGDGAFDLTGIITAFRAVGWTGPWGVEILSDEHASLPSRRLWTAQHVASARLSAGRLSRDVTDGGGRSMRRHPAGSAGERSGARGHALTNYWIAHNTAKSRHGTPAGSNVATPGEKS